jgi:hypothetical protein
MKGKPNEKVIDLEIPIEVPLTFKEPLVRPLLKKTWS